MTDAPDYGEPWTPVGHHFAVNCRKESVSKLFFESRDRDRAISCVNACRGIPDPEEVVPLLVDAARLKSLYKKAYAHHGPSADVTGIAFTKSVDAMNAAIAALQPKRDG